MNDRRQNFRDALQKATGDVLLQWPIYALWRYLANADARRFYRNEQASMTPTAFERSVIGKLREDGIAMVQLSELLPDPAFDRIQEWAEALVKTPEMQQRIQSLESGDRPDAKGGKYYIVRPLGDQPSFDLGDLIVGASLSEPVLRIVCGYLGMLVRISALDLWYSMPTKGSAMLSQRWHRDPEDRALVKTFLYLRDCELENGPFCYVPGTHNAGPFRHRVGHDNYPPDGVVDGNFPPERRMACTGKAGTLIFCDTTGFHKGGFATSGARFLFNTVYTTNASEPIVRRWLPQCILGGSPEKLGPAARYAVGFLQGRVRKRGLGVAAEGEPSAWQHLVPGGHEPRD